MRRFTLCVAAAVFVIATFPPLSFAKDSSDGPKTPKDIKKSIDAWSRLLHKKKYSNKQLESFDYSEGLLSKSVFHNSSELAEASEHVSIQKVNLVSSPITNQQLLLLLGKYKHDSASNVAVLIGRDLDSFVGPAYVDSANVDQVNVITEETAGANCGNCWQTLTKDSAVAGTVTMLGAFLGPRARPLTIAVSAIAGVGVALGTQGKEGDKCMKCLWDSCMESIRKITQFNKLHPPFQIQQDVSGKLIKNAK